MNKQEQFYVPGREKLEKWNEIKNSVDKLVDNLNHGIDENIKEAIIGLTLFGINTTGSCEGHLTNSVCAPYIDFESKEGRAIRMKVKRAGAKEDIKILAYQYRDEVIRMNLEQAKKLTVLLEEFYSDRHTSFYSRLIIPSTGWQGGRLLNQGMFLQKIENEETRKKRLVEFQDEMSAFSSFLKQKFLSAE